MHEALLQSATDAARMLSRKEISSRELTEILLARIEAVNPALKAVVELRREAALREAVAADEAIASGGDMGPLHGVPMTIKDSFNVAGLHTTWGNPAFKDFVADSDATVAGRLHRRIGRSTICWDDVPRIRIGPRGLHSHPGRLLWCLRTEAECRDCPVDRISAPRSSTASERHDVHVRGRPARPISTRPADGVERHRRAREPGGEGLFLGAVATAPHPPGEFPCRRRARPRTRPRLQRGHRIAVQRCGLTRPSRRDGSRRLARWRRPRAALRIV